MFTGLVQKVGVIHEKTSKGRGALFQIESDLGALELGESIAVSGCCLTVTAMKDKLFSVEASEETLARTTLGSFVKGTKTNLERAMHASARFGGHIVSGHVDGVGKLVRTFPLGLARGMTFQMPKELARFVAEKGSITIDGISLTVNDVRDDSFDVAIIRHTESVTTIQDLAVSASVNLEVDLIARYVERLLSATKGSSSSLAATLSEKGYR